jgi:hypothetical protein
VFFAGRAIQRPMPVEVESEDIFLFFFRAHGKKCRSDDHYEKDQCKDKIVDHWGSLLFLAALAVLE